MRSAPPARYEPSWPSRVKIQLGLALIVVSFWIISGTASPLLSSADNVSSPTVSRPRSGTPTLVPVSSASSQSSSSASVVSPQSIPGQPQVDANTVALYHFDSPSGNIAIDATGRYTGTLQGNATITTSGLYAGVLALDGNNSYIRLGNLGNFSQGTVEAFVDFTAACDGTATNKIIVSAGSEFGGNSAMVLSAAPGLYFGIYANGQWYYAGSGINPCRYLTGTSGHVFPYETWRFHHVAGTWGPRGLEIWVDGVLHGVGNDLTAPAYVYFCNPQMYMASRWYPVACETPVPAPAMTPSWPPGDYAGPLPSYNTFLIGCDSSGGCFKGRIDEVRISNVQRTLSYTIVPTITPIPTQTPVAITGEYGVDAYTAALYHLNSQYQCPSPCVLDEATHQYRSIMGNIVPGGRFGAGLASGPNGLEIDPGDLGSINSGAVEAWVKFDPWDGSHQFANALRSDGHKLLTLASNAQGGSIVMGIDDGTIENWVDSGVATLPLNGCWHHVAGTWGGRGMEVWVDGVLRNTNTSYVGGIINQVNTWAVGCDPLGNCMRGVMDEFRVSAVQRTYTSAMFAASRSSNSPSVGGFWNFLPFIFLSPRSHCQFGP